VWRNRLDVVSLVAGLFFLGAAVIWGFSGRTLTLSRGWALPALLVVVGLVGLAAAMVASAFRRREDT